MPHFEKMLYDNAQLLELLALAYQRSGNRAVRHARARDGRMAQARDDDAARAPSPPRSTPTREGEEGKFYVWSKNEIIELIGPEAGGFFMRALRRQRRGQFRRPQYSQPLATRRRAATRTRRGSKALRDILLDARAARVRPGLDDKVLADWNGLMIAALVNAGIILDEPSWLAMAQRAFDFIAASMTKGDRLGHSWRDGQLLFPGLASDFAAMIRAALALFEATGEQRFLDQAVAWQRALDAHYADTETGGYYWSADDADGPAAAAAFDRRRRHAQSECGGGAEPGAARRADRRRRMARRRPTGCSRAFSPWPARTCSAMSRC